MRINQSNITVSSIPFSGLEITAEHGFCMFREIYENLEDICYFETNLSNLAYLGNW